ncbi:collagen alpha-1(I) chain-like [Mauremys reevesii]|uniref:collagen alpha-1(I) chain-like n=1 Tax=Mauremys reevesii TaxID=260615 RepID=UPI0019400803|nr:collagen alpha-1(I) chain-like [Mauremys reevesii]
MVSRGPRGKARRRSSPRPRRRRQVRPGGCNTRCPAAASHLPAEALPADPEPVAAHRLGGNAPDGGRGRPGGGPRSTPAPRRAGARGIRRPGPADRTRRVESSGQTARTPPVYLLTVSRPLELSLQSSFNFPLRYLLTIGLVPVFSLRWSLPPALGCIPKQPDSEKTRSRRAGGRYRPHTVHGLCLDQKDLGPRERHRGGPGTVVTPGGEGGDWEPQRAAVSPQTAARAGPSPRDPPGSRHPRPDPGSPTTANATSSRAPATDRGKNRGGGGKSGWGDGGAHGTDRRDAALLRERDELPEAGARGIGPFRFSSPRAAKATPAQGGFLVRNAPVGRVPGLLSPKAGAERGRAGFGATGAGGGPKVLFSRRRLSPPAGPSPRDVLPGRGILLGVRPPFVRNRRVFFRPEPGGSGNVQALGSRGQAAGAAFRPTSACTPPRPFRIGRRGGEREADGPRPFATDAEREAGSALSVRDVPRTGAGVGGTAGYRPGGRGRPRTSFLLGGPSFRLPGLLVGVRGPTQAAQVFEPPPSAGREARGERQVPGSWVEGNGSQSRWAYPRRRSRPTRRGGRARRATDGTREVVPGTRQPGSAAPRGASSQKARRETAATAAPAPGDPRFLRPGVPGRRTRLGPPPWARAHDARALRDAVLAARPASRAPVPQFGRPPPPRPGPRPGPRRSPRAEAAGRAVPATGVGRRKESKTARGAGSASVDGAEAARTRRAPSTVGCGTGSPPRPAGPHRPSTPGGEGAGPATQLESERGVRGGTDGDGDPPKIGPPRAAPRASGGGGKGGGPAGPPTSRLPAPRAGTEEGGGREIATGRALREPPRKDGGRVGVSLRREPPVPPLSKAARVTLRRRAKPAPRPLPSSAAGRVLREPPRKDGGRDGVSLRREPPVPPLSQAARVTQRGTKAHPRGGELETGRVGARGSRRDDPHLLPAPPSDLSLSPHSTVLRVTPGSVRQRGPDAAFLLPGAPGGIEEVGREPAAAGPREPDPFAPLFFPAALSLDWNVTARLEAAAAAFRGDALEKQSATQTGGQRGVLGLQREGGTRVPEGTAARPCSLATVFGPAEPRGRLGLISTLGRSAGAPRPRTAEISAPYGQRKRRRGRGSRARARSPPATEETPSGRRKSMWVPGIGAREKAKGPDPPEHRTAPPSGCRPAKGPSRRERQGHIGREDSGRRGVPPPPESGGAPTLEARVRPPGLRGGRAGLASDTWAASRGKEAVAVAAFPPGRGHVEKGQPGFSGTNSKIAPTSWLPRSAEAVSGDPFRTSAARPTARSTPC